MEKAKTADEGRTKSAQREKTRRLIINLLPVAALVVLFGVYLLLLIANDYNIPMNLQVLVNQVIVLALVATGAIFIFTLSSFDISLGASTLFSATIGILTYNATGSVILLFAVCIGVAVLSSLLNSVIASIFHLPMFVTTVAMLSVLSAFATTIIMDKGVPSGTTTTISVPSELRPDLEVLNTTGFKLFIVAVFAVICLFVFEFTKAGRKQKFLGGNPVCAKMTGISMNVFGILAFSMAGIGVGLGAAMTVVYTPTVSTATAGSIGMSVFIAIVFGGMPISGGARSRIYAALVGGTSYMLLKQILFIIFQSIGGARDGYVQVVSAIMFILVVFVTGMNYRTRNLPR